MLVYNLYKSLLENLRKLSLPVLGMTMNFPIIIIVFIERYANFKQQKIRVKTNEESKIVANKTRSLVKNEDHA